jgi:quinol-cytochrome oxidoreductase complex cytochrome b subunit
MMRLQTWLEERVPIARLVEAVRHKTVPQHRFSVWYFFGGMTLFFFFVQVVTGALLLLYYRPSASEAYESVAFVMTRVPFGWLVRSIHSWSANLMIAAAFAHLFSVVFLHAYRRPREVTWLSGVLVFFITFAFGFSGYLLPWNELAFFATRVGTEMPGAVPGIGEAVVHFLRGGKDVSGATLTRFFGVHVAILPALVTALLAAHLLLIQHHGMSVPPSVEAAQRKHGRPLPAMPFVPHFALRDLFGWTVALALLAGLSAYFPWELGKKADIFAPAPAGIQPEWYFLWMFQALKYMPATIFGLSGELLVLVPVSVGALALTLLPFLDPDTPRSRRVVKTLAGLALAVMTTMTVLALLADNP